jgi:hypothetical protein
MKTRVAILVVIALLVVVGGVLAFDISIERQVIGSGGGFTQSGKFSINGTIGQPVAGMISIPLREIQSGFWNGSIPTYEIFLPSIMK